MITIKRTLLKGKNISKSHDAEYLEKMQEDRVEETLKQMDDEIPEVSL